MRVGMQTSPPTTDWAAAHRIRARPVSSHSLTHLRPLGISFDGKVRTSDLLIGPLPLGFCRRVSYFFSAPWEERGEGVGGPPRQALEPHPVLGGWAQVGAHQRVPARAKLHRRQRLRRAAPLARVDGVAVCRGRGRGVRSPASAVARDAQRERAAWAAHFPALPQSGC